MMIFQKYNMKKNSPKIIWKCLLALDDTKIDLHCDQDAINSAEQQLYSHRSDQ